MANNQVQLKDKNNNKCYPNPYWPIGSIFLSMNNTNPSTYFGGTWQLIGQGRTLVGVDTGQTEFNTVNKTGGHKELQSHTHSFSATTSWGGDHTHNMNASATWWGESGYANTNGAWATGYRFYRDIATGGAGGHNHTLSGTTGGSGGGNSGNLQPYLTCYMWKRTA